MEPEELAAAIKALSDWAERNAPVPEPLLRRRLREHLGGDPTTHEVLSEELSTYDHVNVQVALDAMSNGGAEIEVIGLSLERGFRASLAEIAQESGMYGSLDPGPVEYAAIDVGDRVISCIQAGLLLVAEGEERLAVMLSPGEESGLRLEAMAPRRDYAEDWLRRLRTLMQERNVYRGKVVAFGGSHPFRDEAPLTVRRLPEVRRERIVLPRGTLERIERHTAGFARHRDALRAAGQHIKRGLLLHGPPGTGKTLTIMHLAGLMPERTVILLTGGALGAIGAACRLARSLEPAMVVLEDVDLVALERSHYIGNPLLFDLLNEMDGLDEDADLIFALTSNRPEALEPALASRPGRIDLAVELPLPDAEARRRLLDLYSEGLQVSVTSWDAIVKRLEGTSPAFVRELMRQATLAAVEAGKPAGEVDEDDLLATVDRLTSESGRLTAMLLGAEQPVLSDDADADLEDADEDLDATDATWDDR